MKKYLLFWMIVFLGTSLHAQVKNDNVFWGIFEENIQNSLTKVNDYGTQLGKKPSMVMWYIGWDAANNHDFPLNVCTNIWNAGYIPHIVWEPWLGLDGIIAGDYDNDIIQFGEDIATYGKPVMLRFGHEFNGDWYPWSYNNGAVVPAFTWITAFKHVHDLVVAAGGTNAIWLWSPNNGNGGNNPQDILDYYPGDDYVDWIAIDGYNWGTSQTWSSWTMFSGVFNMVYQKCTTNYPSKPIMLGEMGCTSTGGDKAAWITDMFNQLENNFTHIKAFIWFNVNKETDWRFNTTTESTNAFKAALSASFVKYDIDLLSNISYPEYSISGKSAIVPGEVNQLYTVHPFQDAWGWNLQWSTTGSAQIVGDNSNDSVLVNWGCEANSLICKVFRANDTLTVVLVPEILSPVIESQLIADSLESNIKLSTQIIDGATYSWNLPDGATFTGKQDSSVVFINWGVKTDTVKLNVNSTCGNYEAEKIFYIGGRRYPYPDPTKPHELPGTIEANEFDYGGEGLAYHDADAENQGTGGRTDEGVDIEVNDGGETVGYTTAGEWLKYSIKVTQPGTYFSELRVASQSGGGKLTISLNDADVLSNISIGGTGGWSTFKSVYPGTIDLSATDTVLKYSITTANFNFGRLILWNIDETAPSKPENLVAVPDLSKIKLSWGKSTDNQKLLGYNVYIDGVFKKQTTDTTYTLTSLQQGQTVSVGITAVDIQNNESDALEGSFTTLVSSVNNPTTNAFVISPNPINSGESIYITINNPSKTNLRIYDLQGRVLFETYTDKGTLIIDPSVIPAPGNYIVSMKNETSTRSVKLLVK
jgi:hypothetical protein